MATPPSSQLTPYPWQPGPAGWLVLDAGRSTRRALGLVLIVVLLMLLVPVLFMLFWVVVSTGTDKPLGGGLGLGVFAAALALPLGLCIWAMTRAGTPPTVVDAQGLHLNQPGAPVQTIPWSQAHGHVAVKTVTQYVPGAVGTPSMAFVCLAFDDGEIPLPGTMLSSPTPYVISQQSYVTALRVLAYDPWHQEAPLTLTEQTYTPWVPTSTYYHHPYHYPYHYPHPFT
ncbi:hypothetical protein [Actinomyces sp. oral taxon 897]|uniref:hypothetical protein n=1 Tax=Actinomyces sp. oral taxon 897 TaxID=2081702 RepID=UPI000D025652|nr:hypothetical protein [Actinomyces sp. oral taxon 897]AVM61751.1 hypothetical protein C3V41_06470 [Actinomyces sp. oral taxon 897]